MDIGPSSNLRRDPPEPPKGIRVNSRESWMRTNGTCLQGEVKTTFDHLVSVLGEPERGADKSTAYWRIEFPDGSIGTVYDYKTDRTPTGMYGWHIGGHRPSAVEKVKELLGLEEE
jgi:hypothetical protein